MKKIIRIGLALVVVGVVVPFAISQPVLAMTGSGTEGDPYIISSLADLQAMADGVTYAVDAYYELGNNIDASPTTTWNWNAGRGVYQGFEPRDFGGYFDGNYFSISGLYSDRYSSSSHLYVGLFAQLSAATISNVVIGGDITGKTLGAAYACHVGILAGGIAGGSVSYVYVYGDVYSTCDDWTATGGHSSTNAGGLVGSMLVGAATVSYCVADVEVYATALREAVARAGGLIGGFSSGTISNCYARGDTLATCEDYPVAYSAGLIGYHFNSGSVTKSYSTGAPSSDEGDDIGGLTAGPQPSVTYSFWDTETSGQPTSSGGTGKTTTEMKTESTFTNAGWDFSTIWDMKAYVNDGYPYLLWWYDPTPFASWDQVLWFEPITIISGTTLPDRASTQDGVITWGTNPAGIAIEMGPLVSDDQVPTASTPEYPPTSIPDMTGPSGQPGWTSTQPTLTDHPFYPVVSMVSSQMNIPIWLVWVILALLILLLIMVVSFKYAPHQIITVIAGGGWSAFMYHMDIFPFWVMFIFGVMAAAVIIGERSPVIS